jgi:hypothetical protein
MMSTLLRLLLTLITVPALWLRGRLFTSFQTRRILFASWYLDKLGRLFLRTPITTNAEADALDETSLGPVPAYMKDEFYYWKTDRRWGRDNEHYRASIFLSLFRVQNLKTVSWRCFAVGLAACAVLTAGNALVWQLVSATTELEQKAATAVASVTSVATGTAAKTSSSAHDDTDGIIAPDMKQAMTEALASGQSLSPADQQMATQVTAATCDRVLYEFKTNDASGAVRKGLADPHNALILGTRLKACRQAGYFYEDRLGDIVAALRTNDSERVSASMASDLFSAAVDHTKADPADVNANFAACTADLAPLNSNAIDEATAFRLVRRLAACQANGHPFQPEKKS